MKRNKMTVLCIVLALVLLATSIFMVSCKDPQPEKQDAIIYADSVQSFVYDGQPHNVVASLNHSETELKYDPAQGYTEKGEYEITVSADETENYKAKSITVTLKITDAPPKSTYELWDDFTSELKKAFALEGKDKLKVNIQANAKVKNGGVTTVYALDVMGNIDLSQTQNNSSLFHAVISADGNNMGVYYQDNAMYLEIGDQLFKLKNSDLTSLLTSNVSELSTASDMSGLLSLLPIILFRDAEDIKCNDGVYELTIDVPNIWQLVNSDLVKKFIKDIISEENMELFDGFFAENEIQFEFAVDLSDEDNAFANVKVENGVATLGAFEIAGGSYDYVSGKLDDEKIQAASEINLANISVVGNIDLLDRTGKDYEHLTYKLIADIEPFALINAIKSNPANWMNDEAVKKMKLYFSLYHEHTPGANGVVCTDAMCPTRVGGQDDTSILDIAFDPQNFGDGKIYVAANLSRVFSDSSFKSLLKYATNPAGVAGLLASDLLVVSSQNFMTAIDLSLLIGGSESEPGEPSDPDDSFKFDVNTMLDPIVSIVTTCLNLDNNAITLDLPQTYALLNKAFNLDSFVNLNLELNAQTKINITTSSIANAVFKGLLTPDECANTDKEFNALRIGVQSIEFGSADGFDCAKAIMHLPTDDSVERTFGGHKPLALTDSNAKATGRVYNLKAGLDDSIFTEADGIHITENEFDKLIGKSIDYTYKAIDGQTYTARTQIIKILDYDPTKINQKQTVKAVVLPLDGQGGLFSDTLWQVLTGGLIGGFLPNDLVLPLGVEVLDLDLTLTTISEYSFVVDKELTQTSFELAPYSADESARIDMGEYMSGKLTLTYSDGYSCVVEITATSDNLVDGRYLVNDGSEHYFEFTHPEISEVLKTSIKFKAVTPSNPELISSGDVLKIGVYSPDDNVKIKVFLKDGKGALKLQESEYRVMFKGKWIDEIDLSAKDGAKVIHLSQVCSDYEFMVIKEKSGQSISGYVHVALINADDESTIDEVKVSGFNTANSKVKEVWDKTLPSGKDICANLDGKLTYFYWNDADTASTVIRKLTMIFENGKYYMVDNRENPSVKTEVKLTAYANDDTSKTNILSDGYVIPFETLKQLSYNATNKGTQEPTICIAAEFDIDGKTVTIEKKSVKPGIKPFAIANKLGFSEKILVGVNFNNKLTYTIQTESGEEHVMMLTYVNGKYVFKDTFEGKKISDIDVEIIVNSNAEGNPQITLVDGAVTSDNVGLKVNAVANFEYDGYEYSFKFATNKDVIAQ